MLSGLCFSVLLSVERMNSLYVIAALPITIVVMISVLWLVRALTGLWPDKYDYHRTYTMAFCMMAGIPFVGYFTGIPGEVLLLFGTLIGAIFISSPGIIDRCFFIFVVIFFALYVALKPTTSDTVYVIALVSAILAVVFLKPAQWISSRSSMENRIGDIKL